MSYTKGPWSAVCLHDTADGCHCGYIFNESGSAICKVYHNDKEKDLAHYERLENNLPIEEKNANSRLISAAPDMLEALKALCPDGDIGDGLSIGYTLSSKSILAARAAIAKAEGGEA